MSAFFSSVVNALLPSPDFNGLAGVVQAPERRVAGVSIGVEMAARFAARWLDFDHVRAHISQHPRGERPRQILAQIDNPYIPEKFVQH